MLQALIRRCSAPGALLWLLMAVVAAGAAVRFVGPKVRTGGPQPPELALAMRLGTFQQILCDWTNPKGVPATDRRPCSIGDSTALAKARAAVVADFFFIAFYAPFLSGLYVWLTRTGGPNVRKLAFLVVVPWLAGALDVVENVCLLRLIPLEPSKIPDIAETGVRILFAVSSCKWALVTTSVIFSLLALLSGERGKVLALVRYSLLSVALGSVPLVATGQGRDVLVALAEEVGGVHWIAFTLAGWLWGLSVWYWSRLLVNAEFGPSLLTAADKWALYVPRVLGALTFAMPGIGAWMARRGPDDDKVALSELAVGCFISAALFLAFAHWRRKYLTERNAGAPPAGEALPRGARVVVGLSMLAAVLLLAVFVGSPIHFPNFIGAPAILALAAAGLVFFGSLFVLMSRGLRVPLDLIALMFAGVFSLWNDDHSVRPAAGAGGVPVRAGLEEAFARWSQQHGIGPDDHVVLMASEGGGIRAAYWAASALTTPFMPEARANRLFAISGVSGGAIGAAAYGAFRHDGRTHAAAATGAVEMLKTPLLAPVLARLFNGEFAQWFLWFPVECFDRAKVFERSLVEAYPAAAASINPFAADYLHLWTGDATRDPPALLFTSTSVEHGSRIVASPFAWPSLRDDRADLHELIRGDLSLAQAAHNSARFSYVSPVGQLYSADGQAQGGLVDGGYFENAGAETLLDLMYELRLGPAHHDVKFDVVYVCSTPGVCPDFPPKKNGMAEAALTSSKTVPSPWVAREALGELLGPVRTLYRTRPAHENLALRRLYEAATDWELIAICTEPAPPGAPDPPLGWEMSAGMMTRIDERASHGPGPYSCSELAGMKMK